MMECSDCCGASIIKNTDVCSDCKEHCEVIDCEDEEYDKASSNLGELI